MSGRQIMTADEIRRATIRLSHEIVEKQAGTAGLLLVGIQRRGVPARPAHRRRHRRERGRDVPVGALDITFYRDDLSLVAQQPIVKGTDLPFDIDGRTVVLVDDVLYTGRTIRAAMDALVDFGRPQAIRLAVLVDRGHRELPIRADHVGKNVPTSREELVRVHLEEIDGEDAVEIERLASAAPEPAATEPRRVSLVVDPDAVAGGPVGRRRAGEPAGRLAPSPPARRRRPVRPATRARHADDRRDARGPGPADRQGPGAARPQGDDPLLRGVDADARHLRGRGQEPLGGRRQHRRGHLVGVEGRVARRHGPDGRGARRADARDPPRRERARRTSRPRSSAAPSSTAATAGTPTRPRRCSTSTRCGRTPGDASAGGPQGRDPRRRPPLAGRPLEHLDADRGRRRPLAVRPGDAAARLRGVGGPRRGGRAAVPRDDVDRRGAARRRRRHGAADPARADGVGAAAVAARVRGAVRADRRAPARPRSPGRSSCIRAR